MARLDRDRNRSLNPTRFAKFAIIPSLILKFHFTARRLLVTVAVQIPWKAYIAERILRTVHSV